jgi:hypothetical protein
MGPLAYALLQCFILSGAAAQRLASSANLCHSLPLSYPTPPLNGTAETFADFVWVVSRRCSQ